MTHRRTAAASIAIATTLVAMATPLVAHAADDEATPTSQIRIDREVGAARNLGLEMGQNRLLVLSEPIVRVSVADPKVADLKVITSTQVLLTARGVGSTDLTLWNKKDEPLVLALLVTRNLDALRRQLHELFPGESISASAAGDLVVLSGQASDVRVPERAAEVAQLHAERVVNLIRVSGNQQVQLEVKFAEVSRSGLREMGVNLFHRDAAGRFLGGITAPGGSAGSVVDVQGAGTASRPGILSPVVGNAFSLFFSGLPNFPFSAMLSLLESNGLAKMLAEPTLVAMSGQEAKFLAGGEFPVPVSTGLGGIGIQWKKFGIILNFTPTVVSDGILHLKLATEVSDIDPSRSIQIGGFTIPALISRQSETTVRLSDGQSFAIAGLLSNQTRSQIDKVPLLGDIPILGMLFRSVQFRRAESELLVVITARLTKPVAPHELPRLPTDEELNDPNDFELFLLGGEGRGAPPMAADRAIEAGRGPSGEIGFIR
ncbi:MAG TPA: type II and III secretion system protein family protein [Polyangia bacterium]|nr:type II and III secretion system protein family protein [Polyangia bacterium]